MVCTFHSQYFEEQRMLELVLPASDLLSEAIFDQFEMEVS
jgi:hypothetical protein